MPHLERVIFRNDLTPAEALDLCITTAGQVDIVTQVPPARAPAVIASAEAQLIRAPGSEVLAGIFNRWQPDVLLSDWRLRLALNLAVDRTALISEGFGGYAAAIPSLTPPLAQDFDPELQPFAHAPGRARALFGEVAWPTGRPLRLAAPERQSKTAQLVARSVQQALGLPVDITIVLPVDEPAWRRAVAEKTLLPPWDVLIVSQPSLMLDATPLYQHREFLGRNGALRAGPVLPEFERLYAAFASALDFRERRRLARALDRFAYAEASALFLCVPDALYAVNRQVVFRPWLTARMFSDTSLLPGHWSLHSSTPPNSVGR